MGFNVIVCMQCLRVIVVISHEFWFNYKMRLGIKIPGHLTKYNWCKE